MAVLLASLPQLQELYIKDFKGLLEFFPFFITVLRIVGLRILLVFIWNHKG
jgi:hypothetical protein